MRCRGQGRRGGQASSVSGRHSWQPLAVAALLACGLIGSACSVKKFAVKQVGNALSSGTSVYETDPDLELVGGALPFSLKLVESLLDVTPRHRGLLVTAAKGFTLYSLAYVDAEGKVVVEEDFERGMALKRRARRLYIRALGYGMRALESVYPGIAEAFELTPRDAIARVKPKDVELLYWPGVALGLSIATDPTDPRMLLRLGEVEALLDRALQLDESWDRGSLHEFRLVFEAAKPSGGNSDVIESSFRRALELSGGERAGVYLSYAEAIAVPSQDRALFEEMIDKALAVDADEHEPHRLLNHLAHRQALWMRSRVDDLFF